MEEKWLAEIGEVFDILDQVQEKAYTIYQRHRAYYDGWSERMRADVPFEVIENDAGYLRARREAYRQLVTLDMDQIDTDTWQQLLPIRKKQATHYLDSVRRDTLGGTLNYLSNIYEDLLWDAMRHETKQSILNRRQ